MTYISWIRLYFIFMILLILSACGSGGNPEPVGNNNSESIVVSTGSFIDSSVGGIKYRTPTQSGITTVNGEFSYIEGESVTFSIGGIDLPSVSAQAILTPLNLVDTADYNNNTVTNIARLLQTLDTDGDASNGITIAGDAHTYASGMSLDFAASSFDDDVAGLVANSGSVNTVLTDAETAITHLKTTISNIKKGSSWKVAESHTHDINYSKLPYNWHCSDLNLWACDNPVWGIVKVNQILWSRSETVDKLGIYEDHYNCRPTIEVSLNGEVRRISSWSNDAVVWYPDSTNPAALCAAHSFLVSEPGQLDGNAVSLSSTPTNQYMEFTCTDNRAIPPGSTLDVSLDYGDVGGLSGNYSCQEFLSKFQHPFEVEFEGEGDVSYPSGLGPLYTMNLPSGNTWAMSMNMDTCTNYGSDTKPYCQKITAIGNGTNLPVPTGAYQGENFHWVDVDAAKNTVSHYYGASSLNCVVYAGYTQYEYLNDMTVKEVEYDENGIADGLDENGNGIIYFSTYPIADFETTLVNFINTEFTPAAEPIPPVCDVSDDSGNSGPGLPPVGVYISNGTSPGAFDWVLNEGLTTKYYRQNTANQIDCVYSEGYDVVEYLGDGTLNVSDYNADGSLSSLDNYSVQFYESGLTSNYNDYYTLATASLPPLCGF